jgi:hypothetical protein
MPPNLVSSNSSVAVVKALSEAREDYLSKQRYMTRQMALARVHKATDGGA